MIDCTFYEKCELYGTHGSSVTIWLISISQLRKPRRFSKYIQTPICKCSLFHYQKFTRFFSKIYQQYFHRDESRREYIEYTSLLRVQLTLDFT